MQDFTPPICCELFEYYIDVKCYNHMIINYHLQIAKWIDIRPKSKAHQGDLTPHQSNN